MDTFGPFECQTSPLFRYPVFLKPSSTYNLILNTFLMLQCQTFSCKILGHIEMVECFKMTWQIDHAKNKSALRRYSGSPNTGHAINGAIRIGDN